MEMIEFWYIPMREIQISGKRKHISLCIKMLHLILLVQKQTALYSLPLWHNIMFSMKRLCDFSWKSLYFNYLWEQGSKKDKLLLKIWKLFYDYKDLVLSVFSSLLCVYQKQYLNQSPLNSIENHI